MPSPCGRLLNTQSDTKGGCQGEGGAVEAVGFSPELLSQSPCPTAVLGVNSSHTFSPRGVPCTPHTDRRPSTG